MTSSQNVPTHLVSASGTAAPFTIKQHNPYNTKSRWGWLRPSSMCSIRTGIEQEGERKVALP